MTAGTFRCLRVTFTASGNENGATGAAGEIIFNGTRGQGTWTYGHFTVPAGQTLRTEFEALMFERGGGDAMEVAIVDGLETENDVISTFGFELADGVTFPGRDPIVLIDGPGPGDFNWDDNVDMMDFAILSDNFGTGTNFAQGDNNADGRVDLHDFVGFVPLLTGQAATAAVPEPSSLALISLAGGHCCWRCGRRRRTQAITGNASVLRLT